MYEYLTELSNGLANAYQMERVNDAPHIVYVDKLDDDVPGLMPGEVIRVTVEVIKSEKTEHISMADVKAYV